MQQFSTNKMKRKNNTTEAYSYRLKKNKRCTRIHYINPAEINTNTLKYFLFELVWMTQYVRKKNGYYSRTNQFS